MSELKSCPFCGGSVHVDCNEIFICESCGVFVRFSMSLYQLANATSGLVVGNFDQCWHNAHWNERAERTCRPVYPNDSDFRETPIARCSECMRPIIVYESEEPERLANYCHFCGAKVVSE